MLATDLADTVQRFISSPPGQVVAGATLAGIVWKFFERVEALLTDETKFEIAVWLVGVKAGQIVEPWPGTFSEIFDRVFGRSQFSLKCFARSMLLSLSCLFVMVLLLFALTSPRSVAFQIFFNARKFTQDSLMAVARILVGGGGRYTLILTALTASFWFIVDYLSILKTRVALKSLSRRQTPGLLYVLAALLGDAILTSMLVTLSITLVPIAGILNTVACTFTTLWLWLYVSSGLLLKAARRFDVGFQWFNRKFDIEKKPLSAIGLVAGTLMAIAYWGFALTLHAVRK